MSEQTKIVNEKLTRLHWRIRWHIADHLSRLACWLRGQEWYESRDTMPGVWGNRAADLKQQIWERAVVLNMRDPRGDRDTLDEIDVRLSELGQIAGENWGHR